MKKELERCTIRGKDYIVGVSGVKKITANQTEDGEIKGVIVVVGDM